jgi:ABC-type transporter Mla subunit MlaD
VFCHAATKQQLEETQQRAALLLQQQQQQQQLDETRQQLAVSQQQLEETQQQLAQSQQQLDETQLQLAVSQQELAEARAQLAAAREAGLLLATVAEQLRNIGLQQYRGAAAAVASAVGRVLPGHGMQGMSQCSSVLDGSRRCSCARCLKPCRASLSWQGETWVGEGWACTWQEYVELVIHHGMRCTENVRVKGRTGSCFSFLAGGT